jgi:glutamate-1-semialdehyde 2,1-aminomutase
MKITKSIKEFKKAKKYLPGGVNSPVRSFQSLESNPIFIRQGKGSKIIDIDNSEYIDFCLSWGVLILGHADQVVTRSVNNAIQNGTSFGTPTVQETQLAKLIIDAISSIEQVRFVNSGTEAVMSAIRLARAFTKKKKILKFDGCYHGHADHLLVSAGSGLATFKKASSDGVPEEFINETISIPFNDENVVNTTFKRFNGEIAAVIVEPVPANMGVVLPAKNYLSFLRKITTENDALLIFDEVITGFRFRFGGVQSIFGIEPDLTIFGKIIGGGFPVGVYAGKRQIMSSISPDGPVYQAGTLSGNPVAVTAGITTLELLKQNRFYNALNKKAADFESELKKIILKKDIQANFFNSMFTVFFTDSPLNNFNDVTRCDFKRFSIFHKDLLEMGIYLSPSQYEANFISSAHSYDDLGNTLSKIKKVINRL